MMPKDGFAAQTSVIFYQRVLISGAERMGGAVVSALVCALTMLILCVVCRRNEMHLLPGHSSSVCVRILAPPPLPLPTVVFLLDRIGSSLVWRGLCHGWRWHWRIWTRCIYSYRWNKDVSLFISLWMCLIVIFTARVVVITLNLPLLLRGWNVVPADMIKTSSEPY